MAYSFSAADAPRPSDVRDSPPGRKRWRNTASKGVRCAVMERRRGGPFASADVPHGGPDGGTTLRLIPPTRELTSLG